VNDLKENMLDEFKYRERVTAFIDILGFRKKVNESSHDHEKTLRICSALKFLTYDYKKYNDFCNSTDEFVKSGRRVTAFSDSIVISYPKKEETMVFLLLDVMLLQAHLAFLGFMLRGGIVCGKLFHSGNIVFGPALVKAYELESKAAIYPRIIIERKYLEEYDFNMQYLHPKLCEVHPNLKKRKHLAHLVKKDNDGLYYVDFLLVCRSEIIEKLLILCDEMLNSTEEPNEIGKVNWLINYIRSYEELPSALTSTTPSA